MPSSSPEDRFMLLTKVRATGPSMAPLPELVTSSILQRWRPASSGHQVTYRQALPSEQTPLTSLYISDAELFHELPHTANIGVSRKQLRRPRRPFTWIGP